MAQERRRLVHDVPLRVDMIQLNNLGYFAKKPTENLTSKVRSVAETKILTNIRAA